MNKKSLRASEEDEKKFKLFENASNFIFVNQILM